MMTPKERAAMQQALKAMEDASPYGLTFKEAITTMREALANTRSSIRSTSEYSEQTEQEPVAWFVQYKNRHEFVFGSKPEFIVDGVVEPLYAAPVRTKDLTDDEIRFWIGRFPFLLNEKSEKWVIGFARTIIAADREKNK